MKGHIFPDIVANTQHVMLAISPSVLIMDLLVNISS